VRKPAEHRFAINPRLKAAKNYRLDWPQQPGEARLEVLKPSSISAADPVADAKRVVTGWCCDAGLSRRLHIFIPDLLLIQPAASRNQNIF